MPLMQPHQKECATAQPIAKDACAARSRLYEGYVSSGQAGTGTELGRNSFLEALVRNHAPANRDANIVDLGCGSGALIGALKTLGYRNIRGFDASDEQVKLAHSLGRHEVLQGDLLQMLRLQNADVDAVFALDVLEHLTRDELLVALDSVWAALRPGGRVIIHVPNAEGLHGMRMRYGDLTHELAFTPGSMQQALHICGFAYVRCYEDRPVVHGVKSAIRALLWRLLTASARLRLLAETGVGGHILSQNMLVVARRPLDDLVGRT